MTRFFLRENASRARLREAVAAQKERHEIVKALSWGQVSRRDLIKLGLFTGAGMLAPIRGLSPFAPSRLYAATQVPTGLPPSPLFGVEAFTQPMLRFDLLPRLENFRFASRDTRGVVIAPGTLTPDPTAQANTTDRYIVPTALGGNGTITGPAEGRPHGPNWAHQEFARFPPKVAIVVGQERAKANTTYHPGVASQFNSGFVETTTCRAAFHPALPDQGEARLWTFNGTVPPKLMVGRYGEPILFRHFNRLDPNVTHNGGFGRHTISTHEHNGHHGAENDGFTGAFFFPGQYYDYHYPILLAGWRSVNPGATDRFASSPNGSGGLNLVPGDWHETMSTHWFHDHMFSFTAQNVYKGVAGMFNIYGGLDRGNESINDGVNLRLPSGSLKDWGNLEYDVNLMLADKAWDVDGQLAFDIFDFDGFLGDAMTVNLCYKPFLEVEPRKYRFRILNGAVSRFFKTALTDGTRAIPFVQIANDGNLLPSPVPLTETDEQGIAERYDLVIDFTNFKNQTLWLVNLVEHVDGMKPAGDLTLAQALSGQSLDPCVGKYLEFRVVRPLSGVDRSQVPPVLIPNPDLSKIAVARERVFEFGRGGKHTFFTECAFGGPWRITTDRADRLNADFGRISAAPKMGTREVWTLRNGGGGWDHPVHIHFEEGQILERNGSLANVPAWERGRKDVYRLRPGGEVTITLQFRDFAGTYMEHCHNTVHEDNAMLLRWDIDPAGQAVLTPMQTPIPSPTGVQFFQPDETLPTARQPGGGGNQGPGGGNKGPGGGGSGKGKG